MPKAPELHIVTVLVHGYNPKIIRKVEKIPIIIRQGILIFIIIVDVWASFYFIIVWVFVFYLLFRVFVAHCKVWVPVLTYCVQRSLRVESSQLLLGRKREYTHKWESQAISDYTVVAHLRCNYKKYNVKIVRFLCVRK